MHKVLPDASRNMFISDQMSARTIFSKYSFPNQIKISYLYVNTNVRPNIR